MVSAFPPSSTAAPDEVLRRYFEAIEGCYADDLEAAVTQFVQGRVPGQNLSFAPTPPEVASAVRRIADVRVTGQDRHNRAIAQLTHRDQHEDFQASKTPESRARVKAMADELVASLGKTMRTADATADQKTRDWQKVNNRFDERLLLPEQATTLLALAEQAERLNCQGAPSPSRTEEGDGR